MKINIRGKKDIEDYAFATMTEVNQGRKEELLEHIFQDIENLFVATFSETLTLKETNRVLSTYQRLKEERY